EVVEVAPVRQREGAPAPTQLLAEARCRRPARLVAIEDTVDSLGTRQKPEALGGQVRPTGAASRQPPAHRHEVVEDALAEEHLALPVRALVAEDRALAPEGEVLGSAGGVFEHPADEPDTMAAAELRHHEPPREELPQGLPAVATPRPTQQPQLLRHAQARSPAQVRLQRVAIRVAQRAGPNDPVGDAALVQVAQRPRLAPEAVVVDRRGRVHHDLLLQAEAVPAPLRLPATWWAGHRSRRSGSRPQPLAGLREAHVLAPRDEVDDVAAERAAEAVPALGRWIDVQVGAAAVIMERATSDQGPPAGAQLHAVAEHDVGDGLGALEGRHVDALRGRAAHHSPPLSVSRWRRRRGPPGVAPFSLAVLGKGSAACSTSSRGAVVASRCSSGLASTVSATWLPRAKNSPSPLPALSRSCRSSGESPKAATTGSMVAASCRISSLMAALASTVRPGSQSRKSATSWVIVTSPR